MTRDAYYLRLAAKVAWRGFGNTGANPTVGCVIVSHGGEVIGLGHHRVFGGAHAEVEALESCRRQGRDPRGATVYVTLEPCSHFGKTPPCADALIEAGVAEVVAAARDGEEESGGGFAKLEEAGVRTRFVREAFALRAGAPGFGGPSASGDIHLVCKWAQTLDGCVAALPGESRWISGERSRRFVHRLRGRVDAVLIGSGTLRADDPVLTARGVPVRKKAARVVLDTNLTISEDSKLVWSAKEAPVIVFCSPRVPDVVERSKALSRLGVIVHTCGGEEHGGLHIRYCLRVLAERHGVRHVLSEAGPRLTNALIREGVVDELLIFTGSRLVGDPGSRAITGGAPAEREWRLMLTKRMGDDAVSLYRSADPRNDGAASRGSE